MIGKKGIAVETIIGTVIAVAILALGIVLTIKSRTSGVGILDTLRNMFRFR